MWRQRDFGVFWAAQTLSVLGDSFALIALPLLVLQATGSVARMGLLTAVGGAASVVAAVFAGAVVDRVDRRRLLIACDLVRMVLYGLIPLVWLSGAHIWLLYAVLPLCEAVGMLFAVGYVTVLLCGFSFLTLGLHDLVIYHLKHDLGHDDGTVGTVLAVGALGTITGALLVARIRRRLGFGPTWTGSVAVCGLAFAGLGWARDVPAVAALSAAFLACAGMAGTCSMSLRQEVTPEPLLGRVTAAFWTLQYAAAPAGAAVLTWAAERRGTAPVALAAGTACVLLAATVLLTPIRAHRDKG
ncbi:MFS transporter [Streptomyces sp. NPDC006624]|uniref:MFS transporter n=1 Tax=Streptomyces sp. NPDC006624 TaxID=3154892 RepID=UPI0033AECB38